MKNQIFYTRQAAVLPLVAAVLGVLILILGLAVELSWLQSTRFEIQSASDLATRSALARLYANDEVLDQGAVDRARQTGLDVYRMNFSRSEPISVDDLRFGSIGEDDEFDEDVALHDITAARVESDQEFVSLLGSLISKNRLDLNVLSVAEAGQVDLVLSLDASRSMNRRSNSRGRLPSGASSIHEPPITGSRWFAVEDAVESFLEIVGEGKIKVGLTTFGGGIEYHRVASPLDSTYSRIEFELSTVEENGQQILEKLDEYVTYPALGLGTSIYDGVDQAIDVLKRSTVPARRFIVLLTDGEQVAPGRPAELEAAYRAADEDITIFVIAYNTREGNLRKMAEATNGQIFSVSNTDELISAFGEIAATLRTRITK